MASIKDTFNKRKEYAELNGIFQFPQLPSLYTGYYLDSWEVSPFYGKVDTFGIPIVPNLSEVKYCSYGSDENIVQALEPVQNFFFPFREQYAEFYAIGAINKSSKYFKKDIPPVKGFIDGSEEYRQKIQELYQNFVQYLLDSNKFNSIKNYDQFTNELLNYVKTRDLYITRAGYVESTDYSLLHTGLALEIYQELTSNDDERINFFNDINNGSLLELCVRNNLKIDRNVPWRLYVDIRTKPRQDNEDSSFKQLDFRTEIKNYIPEFDKDIQLFFDTYYTKAVPYDEASYPYFLEFVDIIKYYYFYFTQSYPVYLEYKIKPCGKSDVQKKSREYTNIVDVEKFVKLYLDFRNAELSKVVKEEILQIHSENAIALFKSKQSKFDPKSVIESVKYYTDNVGTLAYRNPSLYELDEKQKMP